MPSASERFYNSTAKHIQEVQSGGNPYRQYKENKTPLYGELHLNEAESMMNNAIMHKTQFSKTIILDALWQAEMLFDGATASLRYKVYTQSSKAVDKISGVSWCEFELRPGATQVENQYTDSMNEVLNESHMQLIPYTQMIPVRKDIMKKCVNILVLLNTSPTIAHTIEVMQSNQDTGMQQLVRERAMGTNKVSETQSVAKKRPSSTANRGKGLFGMFKR